MISFNRLIRLSAVCYQVVWLRYEIVTQFSFSLTEVTVKALSLTFFLPSIPMGKERYFLTSFTELQVLPHLVQLILEFKTFSTSLTDNI